MSPIPQRTLGSSGVSVGAIGHGLMLLTWKPEPHTPDEEAFESMRAAADAGSTFWNSGNFYGTPDPLANIKLLRRFFDANPEYVDKVFLSVKGGGLRGEPQTEELLRADVEATIAALGPKKKIDLFECARQVSPIEETVPILAKFVKEGLFSHIGLSEVGEKSLRNAHKIHPIAAVEVECSLWSLEDELLRVIKACEELDIALIAYSPLGRGLLVNDWKSADDIPEGDLRKASPRFSKENFPINLQLTAALKSFAAKRGIPSAQLALAYLLKLSDKIIPIPGSSHIKRTLENVEAANVTFTEEEFNEIDAILKEFPGVGERYGGHLESLNWA
ncbi:aldo/keto reductase [Mrakia frigida]|uniref:aldo/keto reductase family protein n=1 Tax=Mrakia frigida TaxID=29902 RepID=UPI003FCC26FC